MNLQALAQAALRFDSDAEVSLIYVLLDDASAMVEVAAFLRPSSFARAQAAEVYAAMLALHRAGSAPVWPLVERELGERGPDLRKWLDGERPRTAITNTAVDLAKLVARFGQLRAIIDLSVRKLVEAHELRIKVTSNNGVETWARQYHRELEQLMGDPVNLPRRARPRGTADEPTLGHGSALPTGYTELDAIYSWKPGLHVLALRSGAGKTTLAQEFCKNIALQGREALFLTLEVPVSTIEDRLVLSTHSLSTETACDVVKRIRLWRPDGQVSLADVSAIIEAWVQDVGDRAGLVAIDYLTHNRWAENTFTAVGNRCSKLAQLGERLRLPILALSQLSAKGYEERDKPPKREHIYMIGAVIDPADSILIGHQIRKPPPATHFDMRLEVDKQRSGAVGSLFLRYHPAFYRITNDA